MSHRTANLVALGQAIATMTFKNEGCPEEQRHLFNERLVALGRALTRPGVSDGSQDALSIVRSVLLPFGDRVHVSGDPVAVTPEAAAKLVPFPDTGSAPSLLNRSYTFTAEVDVPETGAEGMLMTDGGRFAGYGFYLVKGVPMFTWNLVAMERVKWQGKAALAKGRHTIEFDWKYDGPGLGKGGTGTLKVDGDVVDRHPMPKSLPITTAWDETFNVGIDTGTSVDDEDYQVPFPFNGRINRLNVKLGPLER